LVKKLKCVEYTTLYFEGVGDGIQWFCTCIGDDCAARKIESPIKAVETVYDGSCIANPYFGTCRPGSWSVITERILNEGNLHLNSAVIHGRFFSAGYTQEGEESKNKQQDNPG
jgi:hypothetical protein